MSNKIIRIMSTVALFSLMVSLATGAMPQAKANADAGDLTVTGGAYLSLWNESITGDINQMNVYLVDDLDYDGYLDVIVAYSAGPSDSRTAGITAIKGSDGATLWHQSITGFQASLRVELIDDLIGNGKPDVIMVSGVGPISSRTNSMIAIRGSGGVPLWQQSITGEDPSMDVADIADLNGDIEPDVLVRTGLGPTNTRIASITAKTGYSGTQLWQESFTDDRAEMYADIVDDLDGDGMKDVLVRTTIGDSTSGTEEVIAKKGIDGTHLWQQSVTGDDPYMSANAVTDLDGDGIADVLVRSRVGSGASQNATVVAKHGSDGTHLWMEYVFGDDASIWGEDAGDLNGDGLSDILVHSELGPTSNITAELIAKIGSNGTHLWQESFTGYSARIGVQAVDDFDGDSLPDVLTRSSYGPLINTWHAVTAIKGNNGTHLWQEAVIGNSAYTQVQEVGDLDNDSMPDVLLFTEVGPDTSVTNTWMSVKGSDGTHFWQHSKSGNGSSIWADNVGDVNGDSKPDFLLNTRVNEGGDSRTAQAIMKSGSDGTNLWQTGLFTGTDASSWLEDIGDLNGDGLTDVLVGFDVGPISAKSVDMWAYRGYDQYSFWHEDINWEEQADIWAIVVEDLDGDGNQDALVHLMEGPDSNRTIELIARRGDGGTDFWQHSLTGESASMYAQGVDDIDGDGKTDVLVTQSSMTAFGLLYQTIAIQGYLGTQLWVAESDPEIKLAYYQTADSEHGKRDNDLDGDGKTEIVLSIDGEVRGVGIDIPPRPIFSIREYGTAPTIDGVFDRAEWTRPGLSGRFPIPINVYFSNDDTFLYICVDAADESGGDFTQDENDHCLLMFDTNHDEIISAGHEDLFHISANGFKWHNVPESDGVAYWVRHCDFDAHGGLEGVVGFGTSPNSPVDHRIYEFQIPLSLLGASPGDTVGFASPIEPESIPYDYSRPIGFQHNIWPPDATAGDMATWGDLVLAPSATAPVPTLSQWGMIGMGILLGIALVWSVRRKWVTSTDKT